MNDVVSLCLQLLLLVAAVSEGPESVTERIQPLGGALTDGQNPGCKLRPSKLWRFNPLIQLYSNFKPADVNESCHGHFWTNGMENLWVQTVCFMTTHK